MILGRSWLQIIGDVLAVAITVVVLAYLLCFTLPA